MLRLLRSDVRPEELLLTAEAIFCFFCSGASFCIPGGNSRPGMV